MDKPLRIVVIDDDRDATDSTVLLLQLSGHEALGLYSGLDAVGKACAFRPDVIFLDIAMPQIDGYQVARELKQHEVCKGALIVAVSGLVDAKHRQLAKEAGFDQYLLKPLEPEELFKILAIQAARKQGQEG